MKSVNIEIVLNNHHSNISKSSIISIAQHFLENSNITTSCIVTKFDADLHPVLHSEVKAIIIEGSSHFEDFIDFSQYTTKWYVYALDFSGPMSQIEEDNDSQMNIATHLMLPSASIYNLWEHLYYENNIKENLLNYAQTMMEFSNHGVDSNIITCSRIILLHGPPGTGKTSLCKALAHKLAIRMQDNYHSGVLIEINSHSLFSKWFSESGKLVTKMFSKITEIVENSNLLVCVLIDEVESLVHARNQCTSGNEPSDSIKVVNAVLTQIDQIKRYSNVLILTTSNITESIDLAFIDRADIKQYLGLPSLLAIYQIFYSCLQELIKTQIIQNDDKIILIPPNKLQKENDNEGIFTDQLLKICEKSQGLSGRSLRKIPFIAHALFVKTSVDLSKFLEAMSLAIEWEITERKYFKN